MRHRIPNAWNGRATLALLLGALALTGIVGTQTACSRSEQAETAYHCPMHPTYVSDRPGDCPICGMRLVPIRGASSAGTHESPAATPSKAGHEGHGTHEPASGAPAQAPAGWTCPMAECEVHQDEPGRCPKCGMNLVPAPAGAPQSRDARHDGVEGLAPVPTTADGRRLAGVQTAVVARDHIERIVRAVGIVAADETRVHRVHTKVAGWVDRLHVDFTGREVNRGAPILEIYSPDLLATQEEYLRAREAAKRFRESSLPEVRDGGEELVRAARRRLELADVPASFLARLERTGKPRRAVPVPAPASGVVTAKQVFAGQQVEPGTELLTITDLSHVWVLADLAEHEAGRIRVGDTAELALAQDPSVRLTGRVEYVFPYLDPATRTQKVRFGFDNPAGTLKPAMHADVRVALQAEEGLVVPDSAVIDTGMRQVVFVAGEDGVVTPRRVRVGLRTGGRALIADGLAAGERVVVAANFLLDSESRLRAALAPTDERPVAAVGHDPSAPEAHGAHR
jgi:RND family efflux transporter MFP subunit